MVDRRTFTAAALDVVAIVVFVAIGRAEHDETGAITAIARTAAPFLIGLAVGWIAARAWRRPMSVTTGLVVWPITVLAGMITRRTVFDDGTAAAFVVVATVFVGMCLVGWRLLARSLGQRIPATR